MTSQATLRHLVALLNDGQRLEALKLIDAWIKRDAAPAAIDPDDDVGALRATIADLRAECRRLRARSERYAPLPPDVSADLLQDRIHEDGKLVRAAKVERRNGRPHEHMAVRVDDVVGEVAYRWCECGARSECAIDGRVWSRWIEPVAAADEPSLEAQLAEAEKAYDMAYRKWLSDDSAPDEKVHGPAREVKHIKALIAARDGKAAK